MSGYRRKPKMITDIAAFGGDMTTVSKVLLHYQMGLYTGADHYRLLRDLHIQLCDVTLRISGQRELPWVAHLLGQPWPK